MLECTKPFTLLFVRFLFFGGDGHKIGGGGCKKVWWDNLDKLSVAMLSYAKKPECGTPQINLISSSSIFQIAQQILGGWEWQ